MKVLTVSHLFPNPETPLTGVFVGELASALSSQAEDVRVLAPVSCFPILRNRAKVPKERRHNGVPVTHPRYLALPSRLFRYRWIPYFLATRKHCMRENFQPDIIHSHWIYPDAFAVSKWARRTQGAKLVATVHGHATLGKGMIGVPSHHLQEALHYQDHIITVSEQLKTVLQNDFGLPEEKISVIHNGIDPERFRFITKQAAREQLGLGDGSILLCVARHSPEKRLDALIDAVAEMGDANLQLYLIGDGPLRNQLQAQIDRLGLQNRVFLLGGVPHDQLSPWFHAADLFCLSSAHEGCPVVIHEALSCGLPVVSTPVGAVPDLLNSPELGTLSGPSPQDLAESIRCGLKRHWNHDLIRSEGQSHQWEAVAEKTLAIYDKLIVLPSQAL